MKFFKKSELSHILEKMRVLDIIMQPKEDAWLRLINLCCLENAKKYVIANGSGDELVIYITENGVYIKGFDHENEYNQFAAEVLDSNFFEQIYKNAPKEFLDLLEGEEKEETTFCMWNIGQTDEWQENKVGDGEEDGGKDYLLSYICKDAEQWHTWAEEYYDIELDITIIQRIYAGEDVVEDDIRGLNPDRDVEEVFEEI